MGCEKKTVRMLKVRSVLWNTKDNGDYHHSKYVGSSLLLKTSAKNATKRFDSKASGAYCNHTNTQRLLLYHVIYTTKNQTIILLQVHTIPSDYFGHTPFHITSHHHHHVSIQEDTRRKFHHGSTRYHRKDYR